MMGYAVPPALCQHAYVVDRSAVHTYNCRHPADNVPAFVTLCKETNGATLYRFGHSAITMNYATLQLLYFLITGIVPFHSHPFL